MAADLSVVSEKVAVVANRPEQLWPREKSIFVVVRAAVVEVRVEAQLRGVSLPDEVLAKHIGDDHFLMSRLEGVQIGIGVLLAHVEDGEIVLHPIVIEVAKEPERQVGVRENKSAKIA